MYPPPHMTCMYPPPHMTCMYPPPHMTRMYHPPHMTCMHPPPHMTCGVTGNRGNRRFETRLPPRHAPPGARAPGADREHIL